MALVSCPSCSRHVRSSENDCPFCQRALPKVATVNRGGIGSRAAMLVGAGAVMIACGSDSGSSSGTSGIVAMYGAPAPTSSSTSSGSSSGDVPLGDGGVPVALYGAPAPDSGVTSSSGSSGASSSSGGSSSGSSGVVAMYGAPPLPDAGSDSGGPAPLYGAPPAGM
jgi:hypothetical protein